MRLEIIDLMFGAVGTVDVWVKEVGTVDVWVKEVISIMHLKFQLHQNLWGPQKSHALSAHRDSWNVSFFLLGLTRRRLLLFRVLCVTLSPSNDLHITPQISIASKFVGPVDVWSLTHRQGG